jgi:hypothetical protein
MADLSPKTKKTEFKFDIGIGKLSFSIDYVTSKGLAQVHEYLIKNNSDNFEESKYPDIMQEEYFEDVVSSTLSSRQNSTKTDSDEFVLITTYENLEDEIKQTKNQHDSQPPKLVSKHKALSTPQETPNLTIPPPELVKKESSDDYHFDNKMLFENNAINEIKFANHDEDMQRDRCKSDTTACLRFKNILSDNFNMQLK